MKKIFSLKSNNFIDFWEHSGMLVSSGGAQECLVTKEKAFCFHDFYPEFQFEQIQIEANFRPSEAGPVVIEIPPYYICIDDSNHRSHISRTVFGNLIACNNELQFSQKELNHLRITYCCGKIDVSLNDKKFDFNAAYKPTINSVKITWVPQTEIQDLNISGKEIPFERPSAQENFALDMTVDFMDDMLPAPFTKKMLSTMMAGIAKMGIRRVYWIYHGDRNSGFWDSIMEPRLEKHIKRTFDNIGDSDLRAGVQAGHEAGLEVYAIIKPFDMSIMGKNLPFHSELADKYGKYDVLGGRAYQCFNFPAEHPELRLKRRPYSKNKTAVKRIEVTALQKKMELPDDVKIWISDDNWKYRLYSEPFEMKKQPGKMTIDGLNLTSPFFAIEVPGQENKNKITNTLGNLIRIYDAMGHQVEFTYGLKSREYRKYDEAKGHLLREYDEGDGFSKEGFCFDNLDLMVPSNVLCGDATLNNLISLDNKRAAIGIAIGKNDFVPGVMCPSESRAREYWLSLVKETLDAGADGVDIRVMNHSNILEWKEYGFNPVIVDEFYKRYGINILTQKFNMEDLRMLRGEYYTLFLKEAKAEIKSKGKRLQLHISDMMEGSPDVSTMMEINWDWLGWIAQNIPDEVTFKALNVESYKNSIGYEIINSCHKKDIPVHYCVFTHCIAEEKLDEFLRMLKKSGIHGLNLYEHASLFKGDLDENITCIQSRYIDKVIRDIN